MDSGRSFTLRHSRGGVCEEHPPSHALLVSSRALCPGSIDQHMPSPCCCEDFASFHRPEFAKRWIPGVPSHYVIPAEECVKSTHQAMPSSCRPGPCARDPSISTCRRLVAAKTSPLSTDRNSLSDGFRAFLHTTSFPRRSV